MAARVFISHASKDRAIADAIQRCLEEEKYTVFSAKQVLPGEDWAGQVSAALNKSDAMVVLLSPEAIESPNVLHEISFALGSEKYKGRVVPVLLRPTENVPWFLKTIQFLDLTKRTNLRAAAERVVGTLHQLERRAG
jgi:hypothetical protein